jgi:hypothetical protein
MRHNLHELTWEQRKPVTRVEDDPNDLTQVIVTDATRNRASMTISSFLATCRLAEDAQILATRLIV